MGAADILLAEAFLRLEGVCRELVKTLHTVKAAPSVQVCHELQFAARPPRSSSSPAPFELDRAANIDDHAHNRSNVSPNSGYLRVPIARFSTLQ